jgi:hypothetical protein
MKNKIIYPVLIIIFSILVILAILQNKNNKKLNNGIEKFMNNYYLESEENNLKLNVQNNLSITKEFANGSWTFLSTSVDSNNNVSDLIQINIMNIPDMKSNNTYGNITINQTIYIITFITNEIIIANNEYITLNIKFLNIFSNENKINLNPAFQIPNTPTCIISVFIQKQFSFKFVSYKVYNNKAYGELYRIIKAGTYFIDNPPPLYDFNSYNVIIGKYQFPPNAISLQFGMNDSNTMNTIMNNYGNSIKFTIRRVFYSPTSDSQEIITINSTPVSLSAISNNAIPTYINIIPFSADQTVNRLSTFFKPKATILYFYSLTNYCSTYDYSDKNPINVSNSVLQLSQQNNVTSSFPASIQYSNLSSVERTNTSTYTRTLVGRYTSNLNDPTLIPFTEVSKFLSIPYSSC